MKSLPKQTTCHNFLDLVWVGWLLRVGKVRKSIHHCRKVALSLASESQWPQLALVLQKAGCQEATDSCDEDHNMVDYIMRECFCGFCWLRIKREDTLQVV